MIETFAGAPVDRVRLETTMTALCPFVEGHRDQYAVTIEYTPEELLIEAVSLRRYLDGFADVTLPAEELLVRVRDAVIDAANPAWLLVTLRHEVMGVTITVMGSGA